MPRSSAPAASCSSRHSVPTQGPRGHSVPGSGGSGAEARLAGRRRHGNSGQSNAAVLHMQRVPRHAR
eukprot:13846966-Alexandrium_andersonii.AAC.1